MSMTGAAGVISTEETGRLSAIRRAAKHTREYSGTFATEFIVMASQIVVYRLAAHALGNEGFGEYAVARRTVGLLYPIAMLGLGVALPRYMGHFFGRENHSRVERFWGATLTCVGAATLLCVLIMNLFRGYFAFLFFGGRQYSELVFPLSLVLAGLALHSAVYSYFRGLLAMGKANAIQLVNLGAAPIAAFLAYRQGVKGVLLVLAIITISTTAIALLFTPLKHAFGNTMEETKELLKYGVPRVPGDFIHMALFSIPVTLVAHAANLREAGFVAFGITVLSMIASMFHPIGLILLPKASRMLAGREQDELRRHVYQLAKVTSIVALLLSIVLGVFAPALVRVYLGPGFEDAASALRLMMLAAVPYCLFMVLRNLIDAFHRSAINARNLLFTLVVFGAITVVLLTTHSRMQAIAWSLVASLYFLGAISVAETRKILR